jgi:hypothetical protein
VQEGAKWKDESGKEWDWPPADVLKNLDEALRAVFMKKPVSASSGSLDGMTHRCC